LFWSAAFLKEAFLCLGVALFVNGTIRIYRKLSLIYAFNFIILGLIICLWVRNAVILPLSVPLAVTLGLRYFPEARKLIFILLFFGLFMGLLFFSFYPLETVEQAQEITGVHGSGIFRTAEALERKGIDLPFPFFKTLMGWIGPLRTLGLSFLITISPVITSVWNLIPGFGQPTWYGFAVAAYAVSWWVCLPFWLRCLYDSLYRLDPWWLAWAGGFVIWLVASSHARFGAGYDAFRYRDALAPVIMLLAAKGLETTLLEWRRERLWPLMMKGYALAVTGLILFRGLGILRMS
jgi:hypothetical protein